MDKNLPSENITRFFIGKDIKEPRAFGIYKDEKSGNFIVYKNKDTGERVIRYEGTDEDYAVNELYLKLKSEIDNQKKHSSNNRKAVSVKSMGIECKNIIPFFIISIIISVICKTFINPHGVWLYFGAAVLVFSIVIPYIIRFIKNNPNMPNKGKVYMPTLLGICAFLLIGFLIGLSGKSNGYYKINNQQYYKHNFDWFVYDIDNWEKTSSPTYEGALVDYYESYEYSTNYNASDFTTSDCYDTYYSSDWDSDSSWDSSDSWDSGDTDWGSDW